MRLGRSFGYAAVISSAALIAVGCGSGGGGLIGGGIPDNAICTVDGEPVKKSAYNGIIDQAKRNYKTQKQDFPKAGSPEFKQLRNQTVDYLIEQELFQQEAKKLKVKVSKKAVDKRLKDLKTSFFKGDAKAYKAELKKQGLKESEVKSNIRNQLLSEKLFEKVTKDVKVSKKDVEAYYKQNPGTYKQQESREVAHILVKTKAQADEVYAQVKGGDKAVFAKVAKAESTDQSSAQNGGVLTISRGNTVPEFDKKAFELKVGEVSTPVKTQFGFHVITARTAVTPEKQQKFDEVEKQIKSQLEQEKRSKRMQNWRDDLRKGAEKDVECRKGYTWTQTVKSTASTQTPPPAASTPETTEDKGKTTKGDTTKSDTVATTSEDDA